MIKQEAEACLLGSLIVSQGDLDSYIDKLTASHFGYLPHRLVLDKLVELRNAKVAIDIITLKESLSESDLGQIGGSSYLASLIANVPDPPPTESYWRIVNDAYIKREYRSLADKIIKATEGDGDADAIAGILEKVKVSNGNTKVPDLFEVSGAAMERLSQERTTGVDLFFGIRALDELMGGIKRGKLYTVGGKTSHGKTTVAANMILHSLKVNHKCRILYNGFENIEDLPIKIASMNSGIPLTNFVKPYSITEAQFDATMVALSQLGEFKDRLLICSGEHVNKMKSVCRDFKPDITILDYVQRHAEKYSSGESDDSKRSAVSATTSRLQDIAIEFNSAVFNLSQFKRLPDDRRLKEPDIGDLKESGDIENYSDNIILLWWPWRETLSDSNFRANDYRLLVKKNKLGPCMPVKCSIDLETLKLKDL